MMKEKYQVDIGFLGLGPIAHMGGDLAGAGTYPSRQRRWRSLKASLQRRCASTATQSAEMQGSVYCCAVRRDERRSPATTIHSSQER